ncbi:MAG: hypothetical protein JRD89_16420 [Deltaproteobacteria bacterium]|nr:hypothetical protein [Deltaproteobacteria bacterium]
MNPRRPPIPTLELLEVLDLLEYFFFSDDAWPAMATAIAATFPKSEFKPRTLAIRKLLAAYIKFKPFSDRLRVWHHEDPHLLVCPEEDVLSIRQQISELEAQLKPKSSSN